ncbi:hypothetical protein HK105_206946 [Polyrhizophydium stewartii]|uniref:C2H2-type domain-containing protein n=1 Tax=Polyrhizophydium stewartii TaxID=2732419 RepID=A0ABR4N204_9FUNG
MRQTHIDRKSRGQQRIKSKWIGCSAEFSGHKKIDSHIKTHFPNRAVVCTTCRKSDRWLKTCKTYQSKTGCCKTIALGAATLSQRPDMTAGLRIHDETSNRTGFGTIAADLHDIAPMQVDGAVEGNVAASGANAAVAATGSAANMETTTNPAAKKRKQSYKACKKATKKPKAAQGDGDADNETAAAEHKGSHTARKMLLGSVVTRAIDHPAGSTGPSLSEWRELMKMPTPARTSDDIVCEELVRNRDYKGLAKAGLPGKYMQVLMLLAAEQLQRTSMLVSIGVILYILVSTAKVALDNLGNYLKPNPPPSAPSASVPPPPLPSASSSTSCDKDATSSSSKRNYIGNMPHYSELVHLGFHFVCTMDFDRKNYVMISIVPIDPNCEYPGEKPKTKRGLKKVHHRAIFVKISKEEFKRARCIHQHQQVREHVQKRERRQRQRAVKIDIFENMPSIKGTSIANVEKLFKFLAADGLPATGDILDGKGCRFEEMMRCYARHVFHRMHIESYSAKQHWPAHVQDRIYATIERLQPTWGVKKPRKTKGDPPTSRILFVIGDGDSQHNSLGHLTMPTATPLLEAIRQQGKMVCWVDEHRTSKCCSKCGHEMQQAVVHKRPLPPTKEELDAQAQSGQLPSSTAQEPKAKKKSEETKRIDCKAKSLVKLASKRIL